jgi:hypothetical protein
MWGMCYEVLSQSFFSLFIFKMKLAKSVLNLNFQTPIEK